MSHVLVNWEKTKDAGNWRGEPRTFLVWSNTAELTTAVFQSRSLSEQTICIDPTWLRWLLFYSHTLGNQKKKTRTKCWRRIRCFCFHSTTRCVEKSAALWMMVNVVLTFPGSTFLQLMPVDVTVFATTVWWIWWNSKPAGLWSQFRLAVNPQCHLRGWQVMTVAWWIPAVCFSFAG